MDIIDELIGIVGLERASNDKTILYPYSRDASLATGMPDYAVRPLTTEEVTKIVSLAGKHRIPIIPRGGGSGLEGGCVPVQGGIVIDLRNMDKIIEINTDGLYVVVEAGVFHGNLNAKLAKRGFFFPPDPASTDYCSIGGMISTNASGMTCLKYGDTGNSVLGLEVVLADGSVITTGSKTMKGVGGYDLNSLFVGAEGTLGIVTRAILRVIPKPKARATVAAYFDDMTKMGKAVVDIFANGVIPAACEFLDSSTIKAVNSYNPDLGLPEMEAILIINLEGSPVTVKDEINSVTESCRQAGAVDTKAATTKREIDALWAGRRAAGSALHKLDPNRAAPPVAADIAVPINRLPDMLREFRRISDDAGIGIIAFGHAGDGNLHSRIAVNLLDEDEFKRALTAGKAIYEAVLKLEGTTAPEHGVGATKPEWFKKENSSSYPLMLAIKKLLDPHNIMNPGKILQIP